MDRGRKANLCSNKFLYEKQIEERQRKHREKLSNIKAAIDNKPPEKPTHFASNRKREKLLEDKHAKIERENKMLLEKMSYIMQRKSLDNTNDSLNHVKSLNKSHRKQELERINRENQHLLRRIQEREPYYKHDKWEEDRKQHEKYLQNICEYKYVLNKPK